MSLLTESDRESFLDFRDSLTAVPMGFRITIRVDGVSSFGLDPIRAGSCKNFGGQLTKVSNEKRG